MNDYAILMLAAILIAGGGGKKEDVKPVAPPTSLMQPADPLPAIALNDHSTPAFKRGGKPDTKK